MYGGKILSRTEIEDWAKILKKKFGTNLERVEKFENPHTLAQFDPNTNTIKYKEDVTEYFMTHESFHAEEMHLIGFDEYVKNGHIKDTEFTISNQIREYEREKFVYDKFLKNKKKLTLTNEEKNHAYWYFDVLAAKLELALKKLNIKYPISEVTKL